MNRMIKDVTVKRFNYSNNGQLGTHLAGFTAAYNYTRRLKTLSNLARCEYICKIWTSEPGRFILSPIHQMPELSRSGASTPIGTVPTIAIILRPVCVLFRLV